MDYEELRRTQFEYFLGRGISADKAFDFASKVVEQRRAAAEREAERAAARAEREAERAAERAEREAERQHELALLKRNNGTSIIDDMILFLEPC